MIRALLKWVTKIYPASKLFNFLADGLKSKNAKTRTECLGEIANLISVYGENVCQPSPAKALPAIAAQIADRDNSVRNAALNAIVEVYNLVGETVYKYIGSVSVVIIYTARSSFNSWFEVYCQSQFSFHSIEMMMRYVLLITYVQFPRPVYILIIPF